MAQFDVFNGDADGICALHQLRLNESRDSILITGIKRDISLLQRTPAEQGDIVTVCDISLDKNRAALSELLAKGVTITYYDHHFAGEIPEHPQLHAHIDISSHACTSLIVNQELGGKYLGWAVVAAYGDNLHESAARAAEPLALDETRLEQLHELGTLLNYNGYGLTVDDLFYPPDVLYGHIRPYSDPFEFINEGESVRRLQEGYHDDIARTQKLAPELLDEKTALYILPEAKWARRVSGTFANQLARSVPSRAHAILTSLPDGGYQVSVRAPLSDRTGADELCRQFPGGGGRKVAAGINHLEEKRLAEFIDSFKQTFC
jgi:hypothetical protein